MPPPPSLLELGSDLRARIEASPSDREALAAMVRGRALIYAAAVEVLTVVHAVAAKPLGPSPPLPAPAIDVVQRHAARLTGQTVPEAELMTIAQRTMLGGGLGYLVIGGVQMIAIPIYVVVMSNGSPHAWAAMSDTQAVALVGGVLFMIVVALGTIALGLWARLRQSGPSARLRADAHALVMMARAAGKSLGERLPGATSQPMLRHLPEGMALWMLHSVAVERLEAGDQGLNGDVWSSWHSFAADLAMAAWLVAVALGEQPPAIVGRELEQRSFRTRNADEIPLYMVLGAFDAGTDSSPYNQEALRDDTIPAVIGVALVVLSGGLGALRDLLQTEGPEQVHAPGR